MRNPIWVLILILLACLVILPVIAIITGHSVASSPHRQSDIVAFQENLDSIQTKIDAIEGENAALQTEIANIKVRDDALNEAYNTLNQNVISNAPGEAVQIDVTSKDYSYIKTEFGTLLFSCDGVEPYLDGQRIKLRIGNPMSATFAGFKLGVNTGTRNTFYGDLAMQHHDFNFTEALLPGHWTEISFVIAPATPEQIGFLSVSVSLNNVELAEPINN